ncbi:ATP-binding protein [Pelagicoccus albus]|uniref:histidine kinase n=1 Tax=Pelagicoccus albus TaxID=415222 RepID=A0A7X1B5D8_9BACT|nr:ATP-binding protein [Pelagicoccus albus]MBC2605935.1 hypothetical protein [Pelagicoccus albus]
MRRIFPNIVLIAFGLLAFAIYGQEKSPLDLLLSRGIPKSESFQSRTTGIRGDIRGSTVLPNGEIGFIADNGLTAFDGTNWSEVEGLDWAMDFAWINDSKMAVSHGRDISIFESEPSGGYKLSLFFHDDDAPSDLIPFSSIAYFQGYIFATAGTRLIIIDPEGKGSYHQLENWTNVCFSIGDELYVTGGAEGILNRWDESEQKLVNAVDLLSGSGIYEWIVQAIPRAEGGYWLLTEHDNVIGFDGSKTWAWPGNEIISRDSTKIRSLVETSPGRLAIGTSRQGMLLFKEDGSLRLRFSVPQGLESSHVKNLATDQQGGIWIHTQNYLTRLPQEPKNFLFHGAHGLSEGVTCIALFNNRVYLGTDRGLFVNNPEAETLVDTFEIIRDGSATESLFVFKDSLFVAGAELFTISRDGQIKELDGAGSTNFWQPSRFPDTLLVGHHLGALRIDAAENGEFKTTRLDGPSSTLQSIVENREGELLGSTGTNQYARIRLDEVGGQFSLHRFSNQTASHWSNLVSVEGNIYSNGVVSKVWDSQQQAFLQAPEMIYYVGDQPYGFEHVYGKSAEDAYVAISSRSSITVPRPDRQVIGEISSIHNSTDMRADCLVYDSKGGVWAGGSFGLFFASPTTKPSETTSIVPRLHQVISTVDGENLPINHTSPSPLKLKSNLNSLEITAEYPNFNTSNHQRFQIYLQGLDPNWTEFSESNQRSFSNLEPGTYQLFLTAMDPFGTTDTVSALSFQILPPWYRTFPAYFLYLLGSILFVVGVVYLYNKRQIERSKELEDLVKERTKEIELKNAELEKQARRLENQNEELGEKTEKLTTTTETLSSTLSQLQLMQDQLVETARTAGKAEIAINVLHNIGNVLNSVNVALSVLNERMDNSKIANLTRIAILLEANKDHIDEFLTQDPKGKSVPEYLIRLSQILNEEALATQYELSVMGEDIDHIKSIIAAQQTHAKAESLYETIELRGLCENALSILGGQGTRNEFEIINDIPAHIQVECDRHKLLDIVLNLVTNASDAIHEEDPPIGVITFEAELVEEGDFMQLRVTDNGCGIDKETMKSLFRHGFTTKAKGHGFGLHSCANTAQAVGGTLTLESEGKGKGVTAILTLPVKPRKSKVSESN